ncbi:hypothetical protein [Bdellovibrio bacteriovorus]|uniref:hypothetical protein n=1 Tax=Bdellovibrio bacteriovorus TaxID=959 RepID=UPI0035A60D8A
MWKKTYLAFDVDDHKDLSPAGKELSLRLSRGLVRGKSLNAKQISLIHGMSEDPNTYLNILAGVLGDPFGRSELQKTPIKNKKAITDLQNFFEKEFRKLAKEFHDLTGHDIQCLIRLHAPTPMVMDLPRGKAVSFNNSTFTLDELDLAIRHDLKDDPIGGYRHRHVEGKVNRGTSSLKASQGQSAKQIFLLTVFLSSKIRIQDRTGWRLPTYLETQRLIFDITKSHAFRHTWAGRIMRKVNDLDTITKTYKQKIAKDFDHVFSFTNYHSQIWQDPCMVLEAARHFKKKISPSMKLTLRHTLHGLENETSPEVQEFLKLWRSEVRPL